MATIFILWFFTWDDTFFFLSFFDLLVQVLLSYSHLILLSVSVSVILLNYSKVVYFFNKQGHTNFSSENISFILPSQKVKNTQNVKSIYHVRIMIIIFKMIPKNVFSSKGNLVNDCLFRNIKEWLLGYDNTWLYFEMVYSVRLSECQSPLTSQWQTPHFTSPLYP